ncbi:hypothetical protein Esti_002955 [Eimeria stiedai]
MTYHPEAPPVDEPREYDIGVFGATGFVGKLVAEYLCRNYASSGNVKFILAARSLARLEELKEQLCKQYGLDSQAVNIVAADVGDYSSLLRLSKACRVLVTTVGPFMLYGEPVARACVESRTHYCDISAATSACTCCKRKRKKSQANPVLEYELLPVTDIRTTTSLYCLCRCMEKHFSFLKGSSFYLVHVSGLVLRFKEKVALDFSGEPDFHFLDVKRSRIDQSVTLHCVPGTHVLFFLSLFLHQRELCAAVCCMAVSLCLFVREPLHLSLRGSSGLCLFAFAVKMAVRSMRGGVSGATLATGLNLMGHSSMSDPYYLALHAVDSPPRDASQLPVQPRVCMLHRDPDFGYATFFVMSRVNENVVRWSNALLDYRYGRDFVYYEMLACAFNLLTAFLAMVATYLSLLFVGCPPTRYLGRVLRLIPKPGEGPSEHSRNSGYFTVEAVGRVAAAAATKQQQRQEQEGEVLLRARVASFQGDPGYKETAKMLVECALSLALEMEKCSTITGVVSPAAGIGDPLVSRLRNAGMQCEVTVETCSSSSSSYRAAQEEPVRHATKKR